MRVTLVSHTPDPEKVCAAAARLCYSADTVAELLERDNLNVLRKTVALGHLSVLEHAVFSFGIEGISRACSHQLVRHRIASPSQRSQRYVEAGEFFERVVPPSIAGNPTALAIFNRTMACCGIDYQDLLACGIPAEDARFVLPNAAGTSLVLTMNARELLHFFSLRCCRRAQWEIRAMAEEMLNLAKDVAPIIFKSAGPECLRGACPEGILSCGKSAEVRTQYGRCA